ncbi:MAG TPA: Npt1/Npt2 family nucleotide transporter [Thermoanaerobaculia bacterium]|nr:Npt1/Npt2 family nucleotide transporter [Thermoanaerobaculia bacterium]
MKRLGVDLHPGEAPFAFLLFFTFFLFITFQYATKSIRQSTFIDELGASQLPWVYLAVALLSYPFLWLFSRFVDRTARHHLLAATSAIIGASMVLFWWLFGFGAAWVAVAFYVWISLVYVMNVSQFWSFANHVLDPRQARRLFAFVGAGGLLGGILGGQVARVVSGIVSTRSTFLVAAGILGLSTVLIYVIHGMQRRRGYTGAAAGPAKAGAMAKMDAAKGGLQILLQSRLLRLVAGLVILTTLVAQVVDLQFNFAVENATTNLEQRTAFFGNFYTVMGISAFVFQLLFTARIHRVLGVGAALRVLPVTMAVGTVAMMVAAVGLPTALLAAAVILKVGENGLRYSLDQASRELLFLPVPSTQRLKAKAFIDVLVARGAKGVAALLLLPVTFGLFTALDAGWISLALIVVWLWLIGRTYREYVHAFRGNLKRRTIDLEVPVHLSDSATLELVVQSLGSPDGRQVLQGLELLSAHGKERLVPPLLLYHDDPGVRRATLRILATAERHDAAALVERQIAHADPEVRAEAIRTLSLLRREDICSLMLPRLDEADAAVRAAAVACLAREGDEEAAARAAVVLEEMLGDGDPATRAEAAKALGAIPEPQFRQQLIQLLYDTDPKVVREAVAAVRRREAREGFTPIYAPKLIALLADRRLKEPAQEALVAFGDKALPVLVHFMNDAHEPAWLRRAIPKTIASIGTPAGARALLGNAAGPEDPLLRHRCLEGLAAVREHLADEASVQRVEELIGEEARLYLGRLAELAGLGLDGRGRLVGPLVSWGGDDEEPELLQRLLAERLEGHVTNLFTLLAVLHPPRDVWAAHRSLISDSPALRAGALEYLDNTLSGRVRRDVSMAIDDAPLSEKLQRAQRELGLAAASQVAVLDRLLAEDGSPEARGAQPAEEASLALGAVYFVYSQRLERLFPRLAELARQATAPWVRETAGWAVRRLRIATP